MIIKANKALRAYYNEIDPFAAEWLRNLISEKLITEGDVDERSIEEVLPEDVAGYDRVHAFAGIGVWDFALNQAGWGGSEVWTGSCPCQPFSAAGKGKGTADERHLFPVWFELIRQCRPQHVFGEQVAHKAGDGWWDIVSDALEGEGYSSGQVVLPACGLGAPHLRQRRYWMAVADRSDQPGNGGSCGEGTQAGDRRGRGEEQADGGVPSGGLDDPSSPRSESEGQGAEGEARDEARLRGSEPRCADGGVAHAPGERRTGEHSLLRPEGSGRSGEEEILETPGSGELGGVAHDPSPRRLARGSAGEEGAGPEEEQRPGRLRATGGVADAEGMRRQIQHASNEWEANAPSDTPSDSGDRSTDGQERSRPLDPGPANGFWGAADWLLCRDGKWRPAQSGTFPLVNGAPSELVRSGDLSPSDVDATSEARVGRLRGYGNAIVAEQARVFVECVMEELA